MQGIRIQRKSFFHETRISITPTENKGKKKKNKRERNVGRIQTELHDWPTVTGDLLNVLHNYHLLFFFTEQIFLDTEGQ